MESCLLPFQLSGLKIWSLGGCLKVTPPPPALVHPSRVRLLDPPSSILLQGKSHTSPAAHCHAHLVFRKFPFYFAPAQLSTVWLLF